MKDDHSAGMALCGFVLALAGIWVGFYVGVELLPAGHWAEIPSALTSSFAVLLGIGLIGAAIE